MINFLASYNTFPPLTSQDAGFDARVDNEGGAHTGLSHSRSIRKWRNTFVFSLVFAIPTLLFAFMPITWPVIVPGLTVKEVLLFTLSSIIQVNGHILSNVCPKLKSVCFCLQVVGGYQFYVAAYKSLRHCAANMEVLIALATTIAYVYSVSAHQRSLSIMLS